MSALATSAKTQLKATRKTMYELDRAMLDAYKAELGDRKWDEEKGTYTRALHPEEKRLVNDMERVMTKCMETMDRVLDAYTEHLDDIARKPLTFNTPDEETRLDTVMETKDEYKMIRTLYSDAMIDADADLAAGKDLSDIKKEKVAETKQKYDEMSERLCDDALKFEQVYREELAQRVAAHFTAEQQLLRGVASAMKDLYPYTRGLTLDWEDMRQTRKTNLADMRKGTFEAEFDVGARSELPHAPIGKDPEASPDPEKTDGANPFDNFQTSATSAAGKAAETMAKVGKMTQENVQNIIAQYAPSKTKTATAAAKAGGTGVLDKIKL